MNMQFFTIRNVLIITVVAVFARGLLSAFVRVVDNGAETEGTK